MNFRPEPNEGYSVEGTVPLPPTIKNHFLYEGPPRRSTPRRGPYVLRTLNYPLKIGS